MKICILVLTNTQKLDGASRIRPVKLISEFKKYQSALNVYYLREGDKPRKLFFKFLIKKKFDLCYIEPHTFPLSLSEKIIISILKLRGTNIAFFYRDMNWKFNIGREYMSFLKWQKHYIRQLFTIQFLQISIDLLYTPTKSFIKYLPEKIQLKAKVLSPAGEIQKINYNPKKRKGAIYVGGLSERYGLKIMLEAFNKLNNEIKIPLTIICRKHDYNNNITIIKKYLTKGWLTIKHLNNLELKSELLNYKLGLLPLETCEYNQMALPYKLFEYASFGLPVFSSNNFESIQLIEKHNIGTNIGDNSIDFHQTIKKYYNNNDKLKEWSESCIKFIENNATWKHRYQKIIDNYIN